WLGFLSLGAWAGLDVLLLSKVLGIIAGTTLVYFVATWGGMLVSSAVAAGTIGAALLAVNTPLALWAPGGLEVVPYVLLAFFAVLCFTRELRHGHFEWTGVVFAV